MMLCDWCDEPIVMETGDYKRVFRRLYEKRRISVPGNNEAWRVLPVGWEEKYFHDYCFEDGTRGEDVTENEDGELVIL